MAPPIQSLGIVVNASKPGARALADLMTEAARECCSRVESTVAHPIPRGFLEGLDACCSIGGDGTLLSTVEEAARAQVPVMGYNLGKLGFLAGFPPCETKIPFQRVLQGEYTTDPRTLLSFSTARSCCWVALNDIVLRTATSRLATLELHAGPELVNRYVGDGIILYTPTGSTAYNLSAGGPIVHPNARVIGMAPICPHTLSNRSVILDEATPLVVRLLDGAAENLRVSVDGQEVAMEEADFPVEIRLDPRRLTLIQPTHHAPFAVVRSKLKWG